MGHRTVVTMAALGLAVALAFVVALVIGAPPIATCWTGVGPAPEPETSQCLATFVARLQPWERFEYEHTWLAIGAIGLAVLAAEGAAIAAVLAIGRARGTAR